MRTSPINRDSLNRTTRLNGSSIERLNSSTVQRFNDLTTAQYALICGLSILLAIASVAKAAHATTPPTEQQLIKSTFVKAPNQGSGKDPFFPKSTRFGPPVTKTTEVAPTPISCLNLKGISTSKGHRTAIINNRTFEASEEAEIRACGGTLRVKCVEIRDDGITVSVSGQTQTLSLGPKLSP